MNIDEIMVKHAQLEHDLNLALATMERKNEIKRIREEILNNQDHCPHFSEKYNFAIIDGICPYCGKHL